jgi:hypothetical protein
MKPNLVLFYLFMAYLMTLPAARTIQHSNFNLNIGISSAAHAMP